MNVPLIGKLSPEDRATALSVGGVAIGVLVLGVLGVLLAHHISPCNPRNVTRCGRRLASTLQGLDANQHLTPAEEASALCPSLVEALDCYYWFSQRCLASKEQHFYARLYVEGTVIVGGLCPSPSLAEDAARTSSGQSLLERHGVCLRAAREHRAQCSRLFFERAQGDDDVRVDDDSPGSLIDSLYDPDAVGTFQTPLCRALRDFILCGLELVSDSCGIEVALQIQSLQDNLTSLVFNSKCDSDLRPVLTGASITGTVEDITSTNPLRIRLLAAVLILLPLLAFILKRMLC